MKVHVDKNGKLRAERTRQEKMRHRAIRELFKDWHPGPQELLATGEYFGPIKREALRDFRLAMRLLKRRREHQALSLAQAAEKSGLKEAVIRSLEDGTLPNPALYTVLQYADALGQRLVWTFENSPRPTPRKNGPARKPAKKPNKKPG